MNKSQAIALLRENGCDVGECVTLARRNAGKDVFWMTPKFDVLDRDWTIILNDTNEHKLYMLFVPGNCIRPDQVRAKTGDPEKMHIEIRCDTFIDEKSTNRELSFRQWIQHSVSYE